MAEPALALGWRQLPPASLPAPVLAVAAGQEALWLGGPGGVVRRSGPGARAPLTVVAALAVAGHWLLAGGAEGIARSPDGGERWLPAEVLGGGAVLAAITPLPGFPEHGTALAGTLGEGILRTTDHGRTWTPASFGLGDHEVGALTAAADGTVLAGTGNGIYRSRNHGRAWHPCAGAERAPVAALAWLPDGHAVAALETGTLLGSGDGGRRWQPFGYAPAGQPTALLAGPDGALLLGTSDRGVLRSTDGGASWQPVWEEPTLALTGDGTGVYAGTVAGLAASDDGGASWRALPAPPTHDVDRIRLFGQRPLVAGPRTGLALADAYGWQVLPGTPLPFTCVEVAPDGALLVAGPDGLVRRPAASDPGERHRWQPVLPGDQGRVGLITFAADGTGWAASVHHGDHLLRTGDAGATWTAVPAPFGVLPPAALQAVDGALLVATYDRRQAAAQLWSSTDGGGTWQRGARAETAWPCIGTLCEPTLLSLGRTVFGRGPGGRWDARATLEGAVRILAGGLPGVVALTTEGLRWSADGGASWGHAGEGLPPAEMLDVHVGQDRLYALLTGARVWWREPPVPGDRDDSRQEGATG